MLALGKEEERGQKKPVLGSALLPFKTAIKFFKSLMVLITCYSSLLFPFKDIFVTHIHPVTRSGWHGNVSKWVLCLLG